MPQVIIRIVDDPADDCPRWAPGEPTTKVRTVIWVLGACIPASAFAIVFWEIWSWPEASVLKDHPTFAVWGLAMWLQAVVWAVGLAAIALTFRDLAPCASGRWGNVLLVPFLFGGLAVAFLVVAARIQQLEYPLPDHAVRLGIFVGIGFLVAFYGAVAMHLVGAGLAREFERPLTTVNEPIARLIRFREHLHRILAVEAAILGGAIVGSVALRELLLDTYYIRRSDYPSEYIIVYGAFLSSLVALAYGPVYARFIDRGHVLRDAFLPGPEGGTWSKLLEERRAFESLLGLNVTSRAGVRATLAILAPLITSAVGVAFGAG